MSNLFIGGPDDFDTRELKWRLRLDRSNKAEFVLPREDPELLRVAISKVTTGVPWDIQLNQANLQVESGHSYRIVFRARADRPRAVNLGFSKAHDPWDGLGLYRSIELTTEWQTHNIEFVAAGDDRNARIHFDLGAHPISVDLSRVILQTVPGGRLVEPDCAIYGYYPAARWTGMRKPGPAGKQSHNGGENPRFSVVIPTYQRRDVVVQAVRSFMAQEFEGGFEVVVVVDGSKDGSAEALRALQAPFPLTVLEQDNQGSATARNRGSSVARGEILLFLDDDMEAHPRLLAEHERSHSEGANAVLGHIPLHPGAPVNFLTAEFKLWAEQRASRLSQPGASLTLQDLLTGQISVRREVFEKAGRFDVNFTLGGAYGNSDVDFGYRLLNGGSKIVFNLYALSYHNYVIQPRNYLRQARKTGRADVAFARKHPAQARAIFEPYTTGRGLRPQFWRATALLRPLSIPLMAALRSFALSLVEHGIEGPRTVRFFNEIFEMEYWRGVHEAGGMP